ncbi:YadA-like family protein [Synechococcus sp. MIT S9507]|uniref:YadA C-terminal domain-containing protein n=1 Tax=Synechococcus sp. MIT S9507 TaxID=3082544 RepID=UPI0039B56B94
MAIGAQATATYDRSSAVGAGAATTRKDQIVLGTFKTEVTAPNLAGDGTEIIAANEDGTLQRTSMSFKQLDKAVRKKLPKLESAARGLGQAVQASGAIASAMSAIPEVTLQEDEPARCGVGTGAYGSQYAISAGCAVRVGDRLHLNGALSYTPSVDYEYGSTASIAGRLGFSFPLGKRNTTADKNNTMNASSDEIFEYRSQVNTDMAALRSDLNSRDQQIEELKAKLEALLKQQPNQNNAESAPGAEATAELVALLRKQIKHLEEQTSSQEGEISKLRDENRSLRTKT